MFWIRADGNEKTGAGHLMRCMTIGAELVKLTSEKEVAFLCADQSAGELVRQQGFRALVLGTDYRDMASELPVLKRIIKAPAEAGQDRPTILVDSYHVTDEYLEGLRRLGRVVLMDDMGKRKYPVDGIINYNVTACQKDYDRYYNDARTKLLLGSAYVPIREQFRNRAYEPGKETAAVLITAGGGDWENIAGRLLEALFDEKLEYHVVAGRFNPHYETLKRMEEQHGNIHLHCDVTDMAGLMAAADIAVTAGGSTIYELASLGVPFICFSCAENQEPLTEYISAHHIAGFAGAFHREGDVVLERMSVLFRELAADEALRRQYHSSEKRLTDGRGAERLALALNGMKIPV
ncbi:MAG: UDP-2,4-diacetamido-2,4,6-trideoxy-beta-L-altropyranose hydrolase [Firmicutes bacterium]|nr:UDP-2,4-diacetamido-2,4,6-trideoxy-beta-L-altropyranose hydrolase [Bacillota bacterium]